jgi:hypothetical protein
MQCSDVRVGLEAVFGRCPRHVCSYPKSGAKADILVLRIRSISSIYRRETLFPLAALRYAFPC